MKSFFQRRTPLSTEEVPSGYSEEEAAKERDIKKMQELKSNLDPILEKLTSAMKNYKTNKDASKKFYIDGVNDLKKLSKKYNLGNFLNFLKNSTIEFKETVKDGVIRKIEETGCSVNINSTEVTITKDDGSILYKLNKNDAIQETCASPLHEGGQQTQMGGFFDPFSIAAIGITTAVASGITIALACIYVILCALFYHYDIDNEDEYDNISYYVKHLACLPVGVVIFFITLVSCTGERPGFRGGGKRKTARKLVLIKNSKAKKIKVRKTKAKKSKK